MEKELHLVGFKVGRETYGVPITAIREIVRVPDITAVPDAPPGIEGVINLRGKIVSIIDLRKRFSEKQIQPDRRNRILVAEINARLIGLVVDSASEVIRVPSNSVDAAPAIHENGFGYITGVAKHGDRLVMLLDLNKLLAPAESSTKPKTNADAKGARAGS